MRILRTPATMLVLLSAVAAGGCLMVGRADPPPPAPAPPPSAAAPQVEYALGPFTFRMNDGEPLPSSFDARLLGAGIFAAWERRGYVREAARVDADAFSPRVPYHFTVSGSVHATSSFWAQLLNALTLTLVPYPVTNHYDLQLTVQPSDGGAARVASARSADQTWVGLLLVVGLPFAERGHDEEMRRLADALYADLQAQGVFAPAAEATTAAR